jgi:hypothetical protein
MFIVFFNYLNKNEKGLVAFLPTVKDGSIVCFFQKKENRNLRNQLRSSLLVLLAHPECNTQYHSSDEEHKLHSSEKVQTTTVYDDILQEALRLRDCSDCQEEHQRNESSDNDQHLQRHALNDFHCPSSVYVSRLRVLIVCVPSQF